jgi:hypothetical protein
MYVFHTVTSHNPNIKNLFFYDMNPLMLIINKFILNLLQISETRQDFIKNTYCRVINKDFENN